MSSVFDNFPTTLPPHHPRHMHAVPRSLTMPSPAQAHSFPVLSNQHPPGHTSQGTQPATLVQASQDPKKRHACPTCGRAFTTSGHLARHIRVHTGERNHKCPFPGCETRCSRQDNLQQHYRIHLSPGSRRSSSTRARTEAKKKTSLSTSTTMPSPNPTATRPSLHDEPPDSPPPLARATVLPPLPTPRATYPTMSHERSDQTHQGRSHSSASASGSGSSAGSPHSYASATASPDISPSIPQTAGVSGNGYGNILGLSHERQHSPGNEYAYNSSYTPTSSNGHVYPHSQRPLNIDNYGMSANTSQYPSGASSHPTAASSFTHTLPPIQSLDGTNNSGSSFGLSRVSQHPGSYTSYETTSYTGNSHSTSNWSTPESSYNHHQPHHNTWWGQNGVSVGVSVGAGTQRGYHSYGAS